jgi:hypothetical protein
LKLRVSLLSIGQHLFKKSLFGYRRRDVQDALGARDLALEQFRASLTDAETRLAEAEGTLESREFELHSQRTQIEDLERRLEELDKVATLLAEWVVERKKEVRALRAAPGQGLSDALPPQSTSSTPGSSISSAEQWRLSTSPHAPADGGPSPMG